MNLDFLIREMATTYHGKRGEYLSSHLLADFRRNPKFYKRKIDGLVPDVDRPAYLVGRAAHTRILEGEKEFMKTYITGGPINEKTGKPYGTTTKKYLEWADQQDKEVLKEGQGELVLSMSEAVSAHDEAMALLADGIAEGVVRSEYQQVKCQIRLDWFNPQPSCGIVDLKTCQDLRYFEADARRYEYSHQMAFYRAILRCATGVNFPVHMIAVEKQEPFRCGIWEMTREVLGIAERDNVEAIARLRVCQEKDEWLTGYESSRKFDWIG